MIIDLKGNSTDFTHQSLFTGLGEYNCICKKLYKAFCGSRSCEKCDNLIHKSFGAEDYKYETKKKI